MPASLEWFRKKFTPGKKQPKVVEGVLLNDDAGDILEGQMMHVEEDGTLNMGEVDKYFGAKKEEIAALPTNKLESLDKVGDQKTCLICTEQFGVGDNVKTVPCGHVFHQDCVDQWLRVSTLCPVCEKPVNTNPAGMTAA
eukprot:gnl/TRDRNA2_/TRDRNA2_93772_c0_seq1.p1 gnl/TRDRNA2_/TRDRNA2_93772_c0~~gnl/TRDRNA2_/TRDRNA2_93772_c0_seq1.p1  ORF type:complete len:139 (+),score=34.43 gnl/TRDRNA2_/TRDRNA2_93772_c0_seq1:32-448(+)